MIESPTSKPASGTQENSPASQRQQVTTESGFIAHELLAAIF
ncbi:MAG: hypothetical protein ABIP71_00075 [Verrucomicrobiota bacterium]